MLHRLDRAPATCVKPAYPPATLQLPVLSRTQQGQPGPALGPRYFEVLPRCGERYSRVKSQARLSWLLVN